MRVGPKLEVVVPRATDGANVCAALMNAVSAVEGAGGRLQSGRQRTSLQHALQKASVKNAFHVENGPFVASFGVLASHNLGHLTLAGVDTSALNTCAEQLVRASTVVSVRWMDATYDYWQSVDDPLLFVLAGRPTDGLPTRHNGLPPPLDQIVIDTTHNPGRTIVRDGYVEAIGHKMWLGPEFFRRVPGSSLGSLCEAPWARISDLPDGLVEVVSSDEPFVDETSLDVQYALRRLLFPTTWNKRSTKQGHDVHSS